MLVRRNCGKELLAVLISRATNLFSYPKTMTNMKIIDLKCVDSGAKLDYIFYNFKLEESYLVYIKRVRDSVAYSKPQLNLLACSEDQATSLPFSPISVKYSFEEFILVSLGSTLEYV